MKQTTSWIQNHILIELTRFKTRRYSELKPRDVEGNMFMYYLKGLVSEGLVEKTDNSYTLSDKGLQYAGTLSLETGKPRMQPKILNAIICRNDAGEYLFTRWNRQPNTNLFSFPHGMMHYGLSVRDMAARELREKGGLDATLTYRGDIYVLGTRDTEVDRHMLVHLFEASDTHNSAEHTARPDVSESFWAKPEELERDKFVPGFYEIMQLVLHNTEPVLFEEIKITID